jgi:hypothetical protein
MLLRIIIISLVFVLTGFTCYKELKYDGSERYRLNGVVRSENGSVIDGIRVTLAGYSAGGWDYFETIQSVRTNSEGEFSLYFSKNDAPYYAFHINSDNTSDYSLRSVYFHPDRFSGYQYDISEYCIVPESVTLTIECPEDTERRHYWVTLKSRADIFLDDITLEKYIPSITIYCDRPKELNVPVDGEVIMYISGFDNSYFDTLYIERSPVTYRIK